MENSSIKKRKAEQETYNNRMSKGARLSETSNGGEDNSADDMEVEVNASVHSLVKDQPQFSNDLLKLYYKRLFPYSEMFDWLSYGNDPTKAGDNKYIKKDFFYKREFSFTMEHDIYIRYLSFRDAESLKSAMISKLPHKIDIGAVYSAPAKDHHTVAPGAFIPKERELVFDIDMTDYDDVRYCCDGANICNKCWSLMTAAIKVLDVALKEDFGFTHLLWIYSGRRGVHCWVSDPRARHLSNQGRSAIANYLNIEMSGEKSSQVMKLTKPLHPLFDRAFAELEAFFVKYIVAENGQAVLTHEDRLTKLLSHVPTHNGLRDRLAEEFGKSRKSGVERWSQLKATIVHEEKRNKYAKGLSTCIYQIVFSYAYPRLDINVSTHMNHLLKSPWAVHPKTGRVCVPIDPLRAEDFDPFATPTLATLNYEINEYDRINPELKSITPAIEKTSLHSYIVDFRKKFLNPLYTTVRSEFRDAAEQDAANNGDW